MTHRYRAYDTLTRVVHRALAGMLMSGVLALALFPGGAVSAQSPSGLSGRWTLDRDHSDFPREVGFGVPMAPTANGSDPVPQGGGRGGRRGGGGRGNGGGSIPAPFNPRVESADDARRRDLLTAEVRTPSPVITIADTGDTVAVTDDQNRTRTFHPDGRAEAIPLDAGVSVVTTVHREPGKLIVLYAVEDLRQLRYTYSRTQSPDQLIVEIEFVERGDRGDALQRVYVNAANATLTTTGSAADSGTSPTTAGRPSPPAPASAPARSPVARPGSEFAGLKRIGVVVEDLTSMAAGCGLKRDGIESAVAKRFSDAGLTVRNNSDEDTYVYVSVQTSTLPTGMCISRYDWFIYSETEATLSHQRQPVLAQVMLAHKGGLTGSGPSTHAADVMRALDDGLAQIAARIQEDNR